MQIGQKKYNHLKILFIGKTRERIFKFFKKNNISYFHYNEFDEFITNYKSYNFLISYGCNKIFDRKVISYFKNSIINCHQSYLPWNRGAEQKESQYTKLKKKLIKGIFCFGKKLKLIHKLILLKHLMNYYLNILINS